MNRRRTGASEAKRAQTSPVPRERERPLGPSPPFPGRAGAALAVTA
ncbi:MAG: hypothetical protein OXG81_15150 [Acidobacteria bacterium]|nr:hypothetical protein [Acidobacteriota bacterium]